MSPFSRLGPDRAAGLLAVLALHGAALYGLWSYRLVPAPREAVTLFVSLVAPSPPKPQEPPRREPPPPKARPAEKSPPWQIVAEAPAVAPSEPTAPPAPPATAVEAPAPVRPAGPMALAGELSVSCPERAAPAYPPLSRRLGEQGKLVLRVELDEQGRVSAAQVKTGSGYPRLDEAALAAVRNWRCNPARRDGQPVRAVAMQPFNFLLEGR